jgi:hypothetical protein
MSKETQTTDAELNKLARHLLACVPSDAPLAELEEAQREMEIILTKFLRSKND